MTDKNWSQIGDEIEDMVRKALESRDFGKLSQDLSRTVGEAMENVGKSVQDAVNKANDKTLGSYGKIFRPGRQNCGCP